MLHHAAPAAGAICILGQAVSRLKGLSCTRADRNGFCHASAAALQPVKAHPLHASAGPANLTPGLPHEPIPAPWTMHVMNGVPCVFLLAGRGCCPPCALCCLHYQCTEGHRQGPRSWQAWASGGGQVMPSGHACIVQAAPTAAAPTATAVFTACPPRAFTAGGQRNAAGAPRTARRLGRCIRLFQDCGRCAAVSPV